MVDSLKRTNFSRTEQNKNKETVYNKKSVAQQEIKRQTNIFSPTSNRKTETNYTANNKPSIFPTNSNNKTETKYEVKNQPSIYLYNKTNVQNQQEDDTTAKRNEQEEGTKTYSQEELNKIENSIEDNKEFTSTIVSALHDVGIDVDMNDIMANMNGEIDAGFENRINDIIDNKISQQEKDTNDLILDELEAKMAAKNSELVAEKESEGFFDAVSTIFGGGSAKTEKEIEKQQKLLDQASADPSKLAAAYKSITGEELTDEVRAEIQESSNFANNLSSVDKKLIADKLQAQAAEISENLDDSVDGQGVIGKITGGVNNLLGLGTSEKETDAQVNALKDIVDNLDPDSPDFAAQFKAVTGEDFNADSVKKLIDGDTMFNDSKATESIEEYKEGQETAVDIVCDTVSGIASTAAVAAASAAGIVAAPFTAGASLSMVAGGIALGASVGAATNTGLKALDGATSDEGYSLKEAGQDAISGGFSGSLGVITGGAGSAAGEKFAAKVGQEVVESAGEQVVARAGQEVIENAGEELVLSTGQKIAQNITTNTVDGALNGSIGNMGDYVIDVNFNNEDFSGKDMLVNGLTGCVTGTIEGNITNIGNSKIESANISEAEAFIAENIKSTTISNAYGYAENHILENDDANEQQKEKLKNKTN